MRFLSVRAWNHILHTCRKEKNVAHAFRLHAYLWLCGLLAHHHLGNLLVSTFVEAGRICHAQEIFDGLSQADECSWNALIIGYAKAAEINCAFSWYRKMRCCDLHPSGHALVALLKVCSMLKDMDKGHVLHSDIVDMGMAHEVFIASTLIDMYANFGSFEEVDGIFGKLQSRDGVVWSVFVAAHVRQGHGKEALDAFEEMQLQGFFPTSAAFVCALKACGHAWDHCKGLAIHGDIVKFGLVETDPGVGNSLVAMYATLSLLESAQKVFDLLKIRDKFAWTALITGYSGAEFHMEALEIFDWMQAEGIAQDAVSFICSLTACSNLADGTKSQEIHGEIARRGFLGVEPVIGNALIDAYASSYLPKIALEVFDSLLVRDVVAWTALIAGLTKNGNNEDALNRFKQMQCKGISPNSYTYVSVLQASGNIGAVDKGQEVHAEVARLGLLQSEILIRNALIGMYANCGLFLKAQELFDQYSIHDTVSWNVIITGYAKFDRDEDVLGFFKCMQQDNADPNAITYIYVLKACKALGAFQVGQELNAEIARDGLTEDVDIGNALLDMYACCGLLADALEVFEEISQKDAVSWTFLIQGYARYGFYDHALGSFAEMKKEHISPNAVTFACVLKVCETFLFAERGQKIHHEILHTYPSEYDIVVRNTLIDMYTRCGLIEKAQNVFDEIPDKFKDDATWNALILGYSQAGECHTVINLLDVMDKEEQDPDMLTFVGVLNACSHAGLVDMGFLCFSSMCEDRGLNANVEHLSCMVDLLGRADQLFKAMAMNEKMPYHPNPVTYNTLLSTCRRGQHMELGRRMFAHAIELDKENSGTYVTMLNMYTDTGLKYKCGNFD